MSDHEEMALANGQNAEDDSTKREDEEDDEDDESSSSGSDSSSSGSDSSDSEDSEDGSDNEEGKDTEHAAGSSMTSRKNSMDIGIGRRVEREEAKGEALNVNSNRAAARFREQNSQVGLMALGTKKRDRRTIEEIQRDLQRKRGSRQLPMGASSSRTPPFNGAVSSVRKPSSAASSPIKTSPALSPDNSESAALAVGLPEFKIPKGKANSARSRLAKKVFGRGGGGSSSKPARTTTITSKAKTATATGGVSMITNISAGTIIKTTPNAPAATASVQASSSSSSSSSSVAGSSSAHQTAGASGSSANVPSGSPLNEYLSDPPPLLTNNVGSISSKFTADQVKLVQQQKQMMDNSKPDAKTVRSLVRAMLRYGDLVDVNLHENNRKSFADEFRPSNFVIRGNLVALTKWSEDRLLRTAAEIASQCDSMLHGEQKTVDDKQDSLKYAEVEIKPSQMLERLYENLKLRVAVQRAFRAANLSKPSVPPASIAPSLATKTSTLTNHAYVLIAQQTESSSLGISRDCPNWTWAERDYEWTTKKDAALLLGIYVHGFGAWEEVLNDELLHFQKQRALKGERLKKRAETLLKKLPAPDEKSELLFGALAGSSTPSLSMSSSGGSNVAGVSSQEKKGRMQRAAERFAARQTDGNNQGDQRHRPVAEDSIHRSNPQLEDEKQRIAMEIQENGSSSGSKMPEESQAKPHTNKRSSGCKRTAGREQAGRSVKKAKRERDNSSVPRVKNLSQEELVDKWKPTKRLKDIRQILKKMKIMHKWSQEQKEQVILEKMYKYISAMGDAIDRVVSDAEEQDQDELCTCLWTYAAEFTTYSAVALERLYDDICADAAAMQTTTGVS